MSQEQRQIKKIITLEMLLGGKGLWFNLNKKSEKEKKNQKLTLEDSNTFVALGNDNKPVEVKDFQTQNGNKYSGLLIFVFESNLDTDDYYKLSAKIYDTNGNLLEKYPYSGFKPFAEKLGIKSFGIFNSEDDAVRTIAAEAKKLDLEENADEIKVSELYENLKNENRFPLGIKLEVFNSDGSQRKNIVTGEPLTLEIIDWIGERAIKVVGDTWLNNPETRPAYGRYFLDSLAVMIFDTDSIIYKDGEIDLTKIDKQVFFKIKKEIIPEMEPAPVAITEPKPQIVTPLTPAPTIPRPSPVIKKPDVQLETIKYIPLNELYNWWGANVALLDMVLIYIEVNQNNPNLVRMINQEYGINTRYLLVQQNDFYRQKNNTDRLKTALVIVRNLLEQQRTAPQAPQSTTVVKQPEVIVPIPTQESPEPDLTVVAPKPITQLPTLQLRKTREGKNSYSLEDFKLISLALQMGFKPSQIGGIFGVTRNAIIGVNLRQGGSQNGMMTKYSFTDEEKKAFTAKYGQPETLGSKIWSEARRAASAIAKRVRQLTGGNERPKFKPGRDRTPDHVSQANLRQRSMEGATNKARYMEIMLGKAKHAFENESNRTVIEQKFNWLILLLRGEKREKFGVAAINGITLKDVGTARKKPPETEQDMQVVPTRVIEIENISTFSSKEEEIQNGLWYLVKSELEKIQRGQNSRLAEFLTLNENNIPTNRLAISYKQTLEQKIANRLRFSSPQIVNTDYCPPQTGEELVVNYDKSEFAFLEPLQLPEVYTSSNRNSTNGNGRVYINRTGRLSELSEEERKRRIRLENVEGIQAQSRRGDDAGSDRLHLLESTPTPLPIGYPENNLITLPDIESLPPPRQLTYGNGNRPKYLEQKTFIENIRGADEKKILEVAKKYIPNFILHYVSQHFERSEKDILSKSRIQDLVEARNVMSYFLVRKLFMSLPEVGKKTGDRDHTSVLHSLRYMETKLEDESYKQEIEELWAKIEVDFVEYVRHTNFQLKK